MGIVPKRPILGGDFEETPRFWPFTLRLLFYMGGRFYSFFDMFCPRGRASCPTPVLGLLFDSRCLKNGRFRQKMGKNRSKWPFLDINHLKNPSDKWFFPIFFLSTFSHPSWVQIGQGKSLGFQLRTKNAPTTKNPGFSDPTTLKMAKSPLNPPKRRKMRITYKISKIRHSQLIVSSNYHFARIRPFRPP